MSGLPSKHMAFSFSFSSCWYLILSKFGCLSHAAEIYCLTILEAGSLRSRGRWVWFFFLMEWSVPSLSAWPADGSFIPVSLHIIFLACALLSAFKFPIFIGTPIWWHSEVLGAKASTVEFGRRQGCCSTHNTVVTRMPRKSIQPSVHVFHLFTLFLHSPHRFTVGMFSLLASTFEWLCETWSTPRPHASPDKLGFWS